VAAEHAFRTINAVCHEPEPSTTKGKLLQGPQETPMKKLATIRTVHETRPIDGADMIELAVVDGWKCVTKKGEYAAGDPVIYCEIDSFLPVREEFEFLRKSSLKTMEER